MTALRHRVWLLRQSPENSAKWAPLWPVLSAQPNQRRRNIGLIRRCASVSLRAGTGWFGFAIASAKTLGGTLVANVADIEMSRRPMVGAIDLFEADHLLLDCPVQRQVDMRGEFQIGQFSALGDRLDDFRREKRQSDEAGNVAISYALAAGDRGERSRPDGNEFLEPPMGPCDRLEQRGIRLARRCVCASEYEPHLHAPALHSHREEPRNRQHRRGTVGSIDWQRKVDRKHNAARFQITLSTNALKRCRAIRF